MGGKVGTKLENCHFSRDSRENCSNFYPGRIEASFLHVLDQNSLSIYVKCPRKCQKPIILTFFTLPQIYTSPPPKFWDESYPPMCILLKLHSAKFYVSRLFCSKVINLIISPYVYIIKVTFCKI